MQKEAIEERPRCERAARKQETWREAPLEVSGATEKNRAVSPTAFLSHFPFFFLSLILRVVVSKLDSRRDAGSSSAEVRDIAIDPPYLPPTWRKARECPSTRRHLSKEVVGDIFEKKEKKLALSLRIYYYTAVEPHALLSCPARSYGHAEEIMNSTADHSKWKSKRSCLSKLRIRKHHLKISQP